MSFYYDLNAQTRVCSCHREPDCQSIPAENKWESDLIWSLVNYNEKNRNGNEIKASMEPCFSHKIGEEPVFNLLYELNGRRIEIVEANVAHLCFILKNKSINLLYHLPSVCMINEAKSFKLYYKCRSSKGFTNYAEWVNTASKPTPTLTALAFAFIGKKTLKSDIFNDKRLEFMVSRTRIHDNWGTDMVQLLSLSPAMHLFKFNYKLEYVLPYCAPNWVENIDRAIQLVTAIEEIPHFMGPDVFLKLYQVNSEAGWPFNENWSAMLTERIVEHTFECSNVFWKSIEQARNCAYIGATQYALLLLSDDMPHTNVTSFRFLPDLTFFVPMILSPESLSEEEFEEKMKATVKVFQAMAKCLFKINYLHTMLIHPNKTELIVHYYQFYITWVAIGQITKWLIESRKSSPSLSSLLDDLSQAVNEGIKNNYFVPTLNEEGNLASSGLNAMVSVALKGKEGAKIIYDKGEEMMSLFESMFHDRDNDLVYENEEMDLEEKALYRELSIEAVLSARFRTEEERKEIEKERLSNCRKHFEDSGVRPPLWLSHFEGKHRKTLVEKGSITLNKTRSFYQRKHNQDVDENTLLISLWHEQLKLIYVGQKAERKATATEESPRDKEECKVNNGTEEKIVQEEEDEYTISPEMIKELRDLAIEDMNN